MNPSSSISRTVLRRVRIIHAVRTHAPIAGAATLFVLSLWGIGREVWVAKVFANMPSLSDVPGVLSFYAGAFMGTEAPVQLLVAASLGALLWLAAAIGKNLRDLPRMA